MFQEALLVRGAPLLAELELAFQRLDLHFESNDAAQHRRDKALRQLREVIVGTFVALKLFNQSGKQRVQSGLVSDCSRPAGGMNYGEIPRRYGFLLGIPGRRDVTMWAAE